MYYLKLKLRWVCQSPRQKFQTKAISWAENYTAILSIYNKIVFILLVCQIKRQIFNLKKSSQIECFSECLKNQVKAYFEAKLANNNQTEVQSCGFG